MASLGIQNEHCTLVGSDSLSVSMESEIVEG